MDKYIIAIYGFGAIENPNTTGEKMLVSYLRDLSANPEYSRDSNNISVAQFIKLTIPDIKSWYDPGKPIQLNCGLMHYGVTLESPITGLKKDQIDCLEEFMCEQSLEKRIVTIEEHASFSSKKPALILAVNPIVAARAIDDYIGNVEQEMFMPMSMRGSALLS